MDYVLILISLGALIVFIFYRGYINEIKKKKNKLEKLKGLVGKIPQTSLRYNPKNPRSARALAENGPVIDDITWDNLDMDRVLDRMNYCQTLEGYEYLQQVLRNPVGAADRLNALEQALSIAGNNLDELLKTLILYSKGPGSCEKIENGDGRRAYVEMALWLPYLAGFVLVAINPPTGVIALILWASFMVVSYFKKKVQLAKLMACVKWIVSMEEMTDSLNKCSFTREMKKVFSGYDTGITDDCALRNNASSGQHKVKKIKSPMQSGPMSESVMVYVNMLFHVDLVWMYLLEKNIEESWQQAYAKSRYLGFCDFVLSIYCWRASLKTWSVPEFSDGRKIRNDSDGGEIYIEQASHMLLAAPVPVSIRVTDRNVLITGSNASGKSTFLKNIALQLIFAQTVNTVTALRVKMPFVNVICSMGVRDDILQGDSYYMAEIKALKRIASGQRRTVCFVDEVLRGTNTIERIAASCSILRSMAAGNITVFCATHDYELTHLLENEFDNYHFTEEMRSDDIHFSYELIPGKATSRNAIGLLKIMGYDSEIIENAVAMAREFENTGEWRLK